jgi:mycothiol synthase
MITVPPLPADQRLDAVTPKLRPMALATLLRRPRYGPLDKPQTEQIVAHFLTSDDIPFDLNRQFLVRCKRQPLASSLWTLLPGRAAVIYVSPTTSELARQAATACVVAACRAAQTAGCQIAEMQLELDDQPLVPFLTAAGLETLGTLVMLQRLTPGHADLPTLPPGYSLQTYTEALAPVFKATVGESYIDTLDCPTLVGRRTLDDIMTGYQAVGQFEPGSWYLLSDGPRPVGVVLINRLQTSTLYVAYLGIVPAYRGRKLAHLLMQLVQYQAVARNCAEMQIAVDEANTPALNLYRGYGFMTSLRRVAMLADLRTAIKENRE